MISTLAVVLPVFALIFAGWVARRIGMLGPHATSELNRFVVYLALPALLFDIVAHTHWGEIWQPGFIAAFGLGSALVFALTLALRLRRPRHLADAAIDGLNAGYANTGFIGFPLVTVALGREALPVTTVATILTVCTLFAVAIILIEVGLQTERKPLHLAWKVCRSLIKNPLLVAPATGTLWSLAALAIPTPIEAFLKLLGGAASPCALVALGLFLAERRERRAGDAASTALLVGLKLILQPGITWVLATAFFRLSPLMTHTAVTLAALPTGTGPFMLAEFYRREAGVTSSTILVSTILSVATVTAYLALAR